MITGFTQKLVEKGQTFNEFVLTCARGMTPCISMREDPLDSSIPDEFKTDSYHAEALKDAQDKLKTLQKMSPEEQLQYGEDKKRKEIKTINQILKQEKEQDTKVAAMESQVRNWVPPTQDHVNFKEFMLQQLGVSKGNAQYYQDKLSALDTKTPMEFYEEEVQNALYDIEYHTKKHAEEIERTNYNSQWIKALKESLK